MEMSPSFEPYLMVCLWTFSPHMCCPMMYNASHKARCIYLSVTLTLVLGTHISPWHHQPSVWHWASVWSTWHPPALAGEVSCRSTALSGWAVSRMLMFFSLFILIKLEGCQQAVCWPLVCASI